MTPKVDLEHDEELRRVRHNRAVWSAVWDDSLPLPKLMHNLQDPDFVEAFDAPADAAARPVRVNLDLPTRPDKLSTPLAELQGLGFMAQMVERTKTDVVAECRRQGRSWAQIGEALGVARQSAWMKYGAEESDL